MTMRMIWKYEGTPINELGWWDLIRYNAALERSYRGLSGNLDGGKLSANGITIEYETPQNQGGQSHEQR